MLKQLLACILAAGAFTWAQELVQNGNFAAEAKYGTVPPQWTAGSAWAFVNDDGIDDGGQFSCAKFNSAKGDVKACLTQKITLKPQTDYVLAADFKVAGAIPAIRVLDSQGQRLGFIQGNGNYNNIWKAASVEFNSRQLTEITLEVQGSSTGAAGISYVDNISIRPKGAMPAAKQTAKAAPTGVNIARNAKYTLQPRPNYGYCTDPNDTIQLTDGAYSQGYFWTQKSTVGWNNASPILISIDLGKEMPISGFSFNTAAGTAGVNWPLGIFVFTSSDQKTWNYACDLTLEGSKYAQPKSEGYGLFRYATNELQTKGRYVQFIIAASGYSFVDEIEVYKGPDAFLTKAYEAEITTSPKEYYWNKVLASGVMKRYQADLQSIEACFDILPGPSGKPAKAAADKIRKNLSSPSGLTAQTFQAVYPLDDTHASILALNAYVLQGLGFRTPCLWKNNRWDNLSITAIPLTKDCQAIEVEMMRNEVRSESFNICNPTFQPITYTITAQGFPADARLQLREVLFTDTKQNQSVSSAIRPATGDQLVLTVPAGCNAQVWATFAKPGLPKGKYQGTITASAKDSPALSLKASLVLHESTFPERPTLHVGGWDYNNGAHAYYNTPRNLKDNLAIMDEIYQDSPWATNAVLPSGAKFDQEGHLLNEAELSFANWEEWLARFPKARNFCVFWSVRNAFQGSQMGTPKFEISLKEYMSAIARYLSKTGRKPEQLVILLLDEPHANEQDKIIIAWSKAIRAAKTGITLFEDPTYANPTEALPELFEAADILCPNTPMMLRNGKSFKEFYINQRKAGRTLWLYSCSGPSRLLDPISYHRAQKWQAFDMGATGSFYWAFGCGGGSGNSWCPYTQPGKEYSPYYVSKTSTMHAKQSEAIREGVQDYEYLVMLRAKADALRKAGKTAEADKAQKILGDTVRSVTEAAWESKIEWNIPKDHSILDKARITILRALD